MTQVIKKNNDHLDFNYLDNSHLSIQINLDGFSFCVLNSSLKKITALYSFADFENNGSLDLLLKNVKQIVEEEPLLQKQFKTVNLTFKNKLNTFVPHTLFNEQLSASYLQHTIKVLSNDFFANDVLVNKNLVNVYIPYANIINYFLELYGPYKYQHAATVLVQKLLEIDKDKTDINFYVHVSKNDFEVIIIKQNELIFYNSFVLNTNEDFAYFILFTFEQLQLDREIDKIILLGAIDLQSDLYKLIYQYIRNIEFLTYDFPYQSDILKNIPTHQHFIVLNQF